MDRPKRVPPAVWRGVMDGVRAVEARERGYARLVEPLYAELFPSFLDEIQRDFYKNFALTLNDKGPPAVPQVRAVEFTSEWTAQFDQMLTAVEEEWDEDLSDELEDAHDEGWFLWLWLLGLQDREVLDGLAVEDLRPPGDGLAFVLAASFAGVSIYSRAQMWRVNAVLKFQQQLQALAVTGGATWTEIHALTTRILREFRNGLDALALDELFLARLQGQQRVLDTITKRLAGAIVQLWVTRDDEKVCPRCRPLHLTLTDKIPILDTHPRCRCILIPLTTFTGTHGIHTPLALFIRRLTRESAAYPVAQL